jgi:hypothetical protein
MLDDPARYHLGCDHETGWCDYEPDEDDEPDFPLSLEYGDDEFIEGPFDY